MPHRRLPLLCLGALLVAGCSSTRLVSSWKSPDASRTDVAKVLVIAPGPDGATRRRAEDALAREITGAQVVTSYALLADTAALKDHAKVIATAKAQGAQAVVTLRLVANHTEVDYAPGSYPAGYRSFAGYWGPRYGLAPLSYDPITVTTTRVIGIETSIHRVADGNLVWSGLTRSENTSSVDDVIAETVAAVRAQLEKDQLIADPP